MYFFFSRLSYWIFYNQVSILIILIFIYLINKNKKIRYFLKRVLIVYIFIIAIFPTGVLMLHSLESKYADLNSELVEIDGILVLSGMENIEMTEEYGQFYLGSSGSRIIESLRLQKKFPNAKLIFSGGSGDHYSKNVTSLISKQFYNEFSIDPNKIIFESQSKNTYENIINSQKLVNPSGNEKWILLTSAFHMHRSTNTAAKLGWELIPYPVDFKLSKDLIQEIKKFNLLNNIKYFQIASHEMLGILVYKATGRSL